MQNNHVVPSIELQCLYLANSYNLNQYITVVIRLHFLRQNNHVVSSIELLCLYLSNSQNSTHYITVIITLHFLMQNHPSNYFALLYFTLLCFTLLFYYFTLLFIISP